MEDDEKPTCGAKTRTGEPCRKPPLVGKTRCRLHGGKTPSGTNIATFKHGRYSKDLPTRLLQRYLESVADEELLMLRDEIALTETRLVDLLNRVDTGESGALWRQVQEAFNDLRHAQRMNPRTDEQRERQRQAIGDALAKLDSYINQGIGDFAAWSEVNTQLELRRRLVESERKRLVEQRYMLSVDEVMAFASMVLMEVKNVVSNPEERARIAAGIQRALSAKPLQTGNDPV